MHLSFLSNPWNNSRVNSSCPSASTKKNVVLVPIASKSRRAYLVGDQCPRSHVFCTHLLHGSKMTKFKTKKTLSSRNFHWRSGRKQPVALGVKTHDLPHISQRLDAVPRRYGNSSFMSVFLFMRYMDGCFDEKLIYKWMISGYPDLWKPPYQGDKGMGFCNVFLPST